MYEPRVTNTGGICDFIADEGRIDGCVIWADQKLLTTNCECVRVICVYGFDRDPAIRHIH